MLLAIPPQEQTNFNSEQIVVEFDEYVKFKNLNDELLISPPMKQEPTTEIRGRKMLIGIRDTLRKNTTYVLNFGNSIVDLNEGNPYGNFTYVFSTGNEVDSLRLHGQVLDAYSLKADKNILVMLYENPYDSIPMKELPKYVSRTDEHGKFSFSNIREGKYGIVAVEDKNRDYKYNPVAEKIAFLDGKVHIDGSELDSLALFLFAEKNLVTYVTENKAEEGSYQIIFNNPVDSFHLTFLGQTEIPQHFITKSSMADSVKIWFPQADFPLSFQAIVKNGSTGIDTLTMKIPKLKNDTLLSLNERIPVTQNFFDPLTINFAAPLVGLNKKKIELWLSDTIPVEFETDLQENSAKIRIMTKWKEGQRYKLVFLPRAVKDIFGRTNDSIISNFSTNKAEQFSSLKVEVQANTTSPLIMQLLSADGKLVREEQVLKKQVVFEHLSAGKYLLKIVFDENNNGKWDTGKYLDKQFPEKAVLFDGKINLRPKWEQELIWKIK